MTSTACRICSADSLLIGRSYINDNTLERSRGLPEEAWLRLAWHEYDYAEQTVRCCPRCGLVFISPPLSDDKKRSLLMKATGSGSPTQSAWLPGKSLDHGDLKSARDDLNPSIWSFAVRAPTLDASLTGLLTSPARVLDVGAVRGEPTAHLHLPRGSKVDLLKAEPSQTVSMPYETRERAGLLADLRGTADRWDLLLALHVLQQVDDPTAFLADAVGLLADSGLLVVEVPYDLLSVWGIATGEIFMIPHTTFFTPWSLRAVLEAEPLEVLELALMDSSHTGVGDAPFGVLRAVCRKHAAGIARQSSQSTNAFVQTVDRIFRNFAGSVAYNGKVAFKVFVYTTAQLDLVNLLRRAPGFRGVTTSNESLDLPNVFDSSTLRDIDYIITLHPSHRADLQSSLKWSWIVI